MNLYESIFRRKSVRKYDLTPLDQDTLSQITAFADNLKRLYPNIQTAYEIVSVARNLLPIKAPHYFMISSENQTESLENIGFMWQQMDLYLSALGLGSCWLGMARPTIKLNSGLPFIIALGFGKSIEDPHRTLSEFKRKPLSEISSGMDSRLEAVRLAPSATNSQHWFFACKDEKIDVHQKKISGPRGLIYSRMNRIDVGIAICHLCEATKHENRSFSYAKVNADPLTGYAYIGTVK